MVVVPVWKEDQFFKILTYSFHLCLFKKEDSFCRIFDCRARLTFLVDLPLLPPLSAYPHSLDPYLMYKAIELEHYAQ